MRGALTVLFATLALAVAPASAAASPDPAAPVKALHAGLVRLSAAADPPAPAVAELAARSFDMAAITRTVLGSADAQATPAERARLARALLTLIARQIAAAGRQTASDGFAVTEVRGASGADWLVSTRETPTGARQPVALAWRVRREGAGFRIVDSLQQGLSTVGVQHDDFAAALPGHTLDDVIAQIERRAARPLPRL